MLNVQHRAFLQQGRLHRQIGGLQTKQFASASPPIQPVNNDGKVSKGQKVALFVEPSPFSHISGMKNRFLSLIKELRAAGDEVTVFTPDNEPPKQYFGAKVQKLLGHPLPFYKSTTLLLSLGVSLNVVQYLVRNRPDIIHVSSPGLAVFAVIIYAKLLQIPVVVSYHTHIPEYIPRYTWRGLVEPMWQLIRWCTAQSDMTLVTSKAMKAELSKNNCENKKIEVWQRGVDTHQFNPRFRDAGMRSQLTDGHPEDPVMVCVGRLGAEKNISSFKNIMDNLPGVRLALVGDGPQREELEEMFKGYPVKFMGMMKGDELSKAYASGDIFVMPSETETLGFVVLEAMASGLPVVAVAAGGLTDIITEPGKTGLLYQPSDYKGAAKLVRSLLDDRTYLSTIAQGGRLEVEKWGWGAATAKLRKQQYRRAILRHGVYNRLRNFLMKLSLLRFFKAMTRFILGLWAAAVVFVARLMGYFDTKPPAATVL